MTALHEAVEDYLRVRRALGFKLENEGEHLRSFAAYMQTTGAETVTVAHAVRLGDSAGFGKACVLGQAPGGGARVRALPAAA